MCKKLKSKRIALDLNTPPSPMKTTASHSKTFHESFSEPAKNPPLTELEGKVTAVPAVMHHRPKNGHVNNKQITRKKVIRVLLDSGSDGDLMFHRKGAHMHFPNSTRQVPMSWNTSNGVFNTKRRGSIYLNFLNTAKVKRS